MVTRKLIFLLLLPIIWGCGGMGGKSDQEEAAPRIAKEDVRPMLGTADLVLLDVRSESDWAESDMKIKGATRENARDYAQWSGKYPKDKTLVLYCA